MNWEADIGCFFKKMAFFASAAIPDASLPRDSENLKSSFIAESSEYFVNFVFSFVIIPKIPHIKFLF